MFARHPARLTREWAQAVVEHHAPGAKVEAVQLLHVDIGTTTRVLLQVTHSDRQLPARWFVKLRSGSLKARLMTWLPQLLQTEVRFYQEVAAELPIRIPYALVAERRWGRGITLALADVTESGGRPGDSGEELSLDQAHAMTGLLAELHAVFWDSPRFQQDLAWLDGPVRRLEDRLGSALAVRLMRRGLARAGGDVAAALHEPALAYARRRRQVMQQLNAGPKTLVHHDCHPGNLFWQGDAPGLLDWQLVRTGEGVGDLAYLLATGLEPDRRRREEPALLETYRDALLENGVDAPGVEALNERYQAHLVYPFEAMVVTLAIGSMMEEESNRTLLRRAAAAALDQEAFRVVGT